MAATDKETPPARPFEELLAGFTHMNNNQRTLFLFHIQEDVVKNVCNNFVVVCKEIDTLSARCEVLKEACHKQEAQLRHFESLFKRIDPLGQAQGFTGAAPLAEKEESPSNDAVSSKVQHLPPQQEDLTT